MSMHLQEHLRGPQNSLKITTIQTSLFIGDKTDTEKGQKICPEFTAQ